MARRHILAELRAVKRQPFLWSGCPPTSSRVDEDLRWMIDNGYVGWLNKDTALGPKAGYVITEKGVALLDQNDAPLSPLPTL